MQITIVEAEILTAVRNYILGQIAVREDMTIDVDLRATRGSEGFTAVIDIHPSNGPKGGEPAPKAEVKADAAAKDKKVEPAKTEAPKAEAAKVDTTTQTAEEPKAEVQVEVKKTLAKSVFAKKEDEATDTTEESADVVSIETAKPEPVQATGRSIFGGLTKPVNPKSDAA